MSRRGVSGWMFLVVPAHPGRPGQRAVKWSLAHARVCVEQLVVDGIASCCCIYMAG